MDLLWIATKAPVPTTDGGRLVQRLTLEALAGLGVRVTLVAPLAAGEEAAACSRWMAPWGRAHLVRPGPSRHLAALRALLPGGLPLAIAKHHRPCVRAEVARRVAAQAFTAVHVEQIHALPQAAPAFAAGLPVVLRAQNVESELWWRNAALNRLRRLVVALEGQRLARWEGHAVRRATATLALSPLDAARLGALSGGTAVHWLPPPFPARLPAGEEPLPGEPPVVHLGSAGWLPNRDAESWLVEAIWPLLRRRLPGAELHLFGGGSPRRGAGISVHPPPADSRDAFPPGAVLVVPLRVGSGIRMKILEAWARGCPVVATPEAAAGLEAEAGRHLLLAGDPEEMAAAVVRIHQEPALRQRLVEEARELLARRHAPDRVARDLVARYGEARRGA